MESLGKGHVFRAPSQLEALAVYSDKDNGSVHFNDWLYGGQEAVDNYDYGVDEYWKWFNDEMYQGEMDIFVTPSAKSLLGPKDHEDVTAVHNDSKLIFCLLSEVEKLESQGFEDYHADAAVFNPVSGVEASIYDVIDGTETEEELQALAEAVLGKDGES